MLQIVYLTFVFFALNLMAHSVHAANWTAGAAEPLMGTEAKLSGGLSVKPNAAGQILLQFPPRNLSLDRHSTVRLKFNGAPPLQVYLIWRNNIDESQLHQFGHALKGDSNPVIDMSGNVNWRGEANLLQLGFRGIPGNRVEFFEMEIYHPGLDDYVLELWRNWSSFAGWKPVDINVYTGTKNFNIGPYPVPALAALMIAGLIVYVIIARRSASWKGVGLVLFSFWLALDVLWQLRLWRQAALTQSTLATASNNEKLKLADDGMISELAMNASASIKDPNAKVFIASATDYNGMHAAYHMSPLNAFWHRNGPELPPFANIKAGNFILLVRPSMVKLDIKNNLIVDETGDTLAVARRYENRSGLLLEVLP